MSGEWTIDWVWWITAVEVPALGGLFWLFHYGRREAERNLLRVYGELQGNLNAALENVAQSRLEVAQLYATVDDLKEVEKRLTDHLLRLESRITYVLSGQPPGRNGSRPERDAETEAMRDRADGE